MRLSVRPTDNRRAFTLAEVLAALAFMAIVLPVAVEGLRLASGAGVVGERRASAALVAERLLNELALAQSSGTQSSGQSGTIQVGTELYEWQAQWNSWPEDSMSELTVQVLYTVRGRNYDVQLTTLIDTTASTQ